MLRFDGHVVEEVSGGSEMLETMAGMIAELVKESFRALATREACGEAEQSGSIQPFRRGRPASNKSESAIDVATRATGC